MHKIPDNWVWTTIGDVGIVVSGGTPSTKKNEYWEGDIAWITPADLSKYDEKYISKGKRSITREGLDYSSAKLLPKGTILFSSRAPIGYTVIAKNELATNQGFKNLIATESLSNDYVYYYFKTLKKLAEDVASGTTFLELSASKFSKLPFPLAPLEEQKQIVLKVEKLFSELIYIEKILFKVIKDLDFYRYKILDDIFTKNCNSRKIIKIKDVGEIITGNTPSKKRLEYYGHDYNFYKPSDLSLYSKIDSSQDKLSSVGYNISKKVSLGSVLVVAIGNSIGKVALIKKEGSFNQQMHAIVPKKVFLEEFVFYQLIGVKFQNLLKSNASATTLPIINKNKFSELEFISYSLETQKLIVLEIEQKFSLIDNLKITTEKTLQQIDQLRLKVLDNAFKGKLVKNIIEDKNAKALLKKILSEKVKYTKQKQRNQVKKIKKRKTMSDNLSILEILQNSDKPMQVKELWQTSQYKDDIEKFYSELKKIEGKLEEIKSDDKDVFIKVKNAN